MQGALPRVVEITILSSSGSREVNIRCPLQPMIGQHVFNFRNNGRAMAWSSIWVDMFPCIQSRILDMSTKTTWHDYYMSSTYVLHRRLMCIVCANFSPASLYLLI